MVSSGLAGWEGEREKAVAVAGLDPLLVLCWGNIVKDS